MDEVSYGDVWVRHLDNGSVDVSVDVGNDKFAKLYTDPNGDSLHSSDAPHPRHYSESVKVWSK